MSPQTPDSWSDMITSPDNTPRGTRHIQTYIHGCVQICVQRCGHTCKGTPGHPNGTSAGTAVHLLFGLELLSMSPARRSRPRGPTLQTMTLRNCWSCKEGPSLESNQNFCCKAFALLKALTPVASDRSILNGKSSSLPAPAPLELRGRHISGNHLTNRFKVLKSFCLGI